MAGAVFLILCDTDVIVEPYLNHSRMIDQHHKMFKIIECLRGGACRSKAPEDGKSLCFTSAFGERVGRRKRQE